MRSELVAKRKWLSDPTFLDLLGVTNLLPGPNSTEMAIHIGYIRAGVAGLLVAGIAFILPSALIVTLCAWIYLHFGQLPLIIGVLYFAQPLVIAIVLHAAISLTISTKRVQKELIPLVITYGVCALFLPEIVLICCGGLLSAFWLMCRDTQERARGRKSLLTFLLLGSLSIIVCSLTHPGTVFSHGGSAGEPYSDSGLGLFFLKIGSLIYGSGYVLLAFLREGLVEELGWLTGAQLLDASAVGQITPGPVFTTATFIGYILGGVKGALYATIGIFLPAFVFVGAAGPLIAVVKRSTMVKAFLDGVTLASLALLYSVAFQLAISSFSQIAPLGVGAMAFMLMHFYKVSPAIVLLGGIVIGALGSFVV